MGEVRSCIFCCRYGTNRILIQIHYELVEIAATAADGRPAAEPPSTKKERKPARYEVVDRDYSGIRAICRDCLCGLTKIGLFS